MAAAVASQAKGLALLASAAALFVLGTHVWQARPTHGASTAATPLCATPVAVAGSGGLLLSCADDPQLHGCSRLQAGDLARLDDTRCEVVPGAMPGSMRLLVGLKLRLNHASADELALIDGIGTKTAARIVADRQQLGPFDDVGELVRVAGIGEKTAERLRQFVTAQ